MVELLSITLYIVAVRSSMVVRVGLLEEEQAQLQAALKETAQAFAPSIARVDTTFFEPGNLGGNARRNKSI